jgi:PAS domain S-box-containing protein
MARNLFMRTPQQWRATAVNCYCLGRIIFNIKSLSLYEMRTIENSESDMFRFFEMTPDLVCIAGKDGFFRKVNNAVIKKLEYSEEELFAQPISSFIHPEDKERTGERRSQLLNGSALMNFDNRYISKTGKIIWLHWTSIYLPEKEVVFALAKDVTERKQIEKKTEENYKKFKGLAIHFKTHIEKDRKYFAFELHEELAQLASAINFDIDGVINSSPQLPEAAKHRLEKASAISQLLLKKIRKLSFRISPNTLDHLGLDETLQWLCKDFTNVTEIPCRFESNYSEHELTQEIKIDFFRICQESLNNVMHHSQATLVKIIIEQVGDEICLLIIDDGKGFNIKEEKKLSGLINIRELATSINGELNVESAPGKGTEICVRIKKHTMINANS